MQRFLRRVTAPGGIALAALLIAAGNLLSRGVGLLREAVIAGQFGRGAEVAAFTAASAIPTIVYDLLVNGALSAALIPVFAAAAARDEAEFWALVRAVAAVLLPTVALVVVLLIWQAEPATRLLAGGFAPDLRDLTITMVRWMLPAVLALALSGIITAALQARRQFLLPAFTTSAYNAGIIVGALLLTPWLGPLALAVGVVLGALLQVLLQLPGLAPARTFSFTIDLRQPELRRIVWLYAPVALGISFAVAGIVLDRNLASRLDAAALPTMRYATTLIQLPLGLVAAAVSFAVLPTLARHAAAGEDGAFGGVLASGINVVALLILPATALLAGAGEALVALIFERRAFSAQDTAGVAHALLLYLPGLPAAAFDQMLLFAFYARGRTLTPNLVQGAAVGCYAVAALGLPQLGVAGLDALIIANSVQWVGHLVILFVLARGVVRLRGQQVGETLAKCGVAALLAGLVAYGIAQSSVGLPAIVRVALAFGGAGALYLGLCAALRVPALLLLRDAVLRKVG